MGTPGIASGNILVEGAYVVSHHGRHTGERR
jgi:hypothetical protein